MAPSVREQLEALNEECEEFCSDKSNWTKKWHGEDSEGNPNFLLSYSSVETFEQPGGVMILGTNPGGDHRRAKFHPISDPFDRPSWSSYLDDDWGNDDPGEEKGQRAVRRIADIIAASAGGGDELLRRIPTGNLIPFRSKRPMHLQRPREEPKVSPYDYGLEVGLRLIRIARPRVVILTASDGARWARLTTRLTSNSVQECSKDLPGSNRVFREAIFSGTRPRPEFIWALPRVNTGTAGKCPGEVLRKRLRKHRVAVTKSGQVRVSRQ